jgi:hypothetical protein
MKKVLLSLIAAGLAAAFLITCQKEGEKPLETELNQVSINGAEYIARIYSFVETLEEIKTGNYLKQDEKMTVSESVEYIESALNIIHCFPDAEISEMATLSEIVLIPKDEHDEMDMETLAVFYDDVKDIIRNLLRNSGFDDRKLIMVAMEIFEAKDSVTIKSLIGNIKAKEFPEKDYWYGDLLGACDTTYVFETDAAKVIESLTHDYFISLRPTPPAGCRYVYVNPASKEIDDPYNEIYQLNFPPVNYLDFKVFFASDYYNDPPVGYLDDNIKCLGYYDEMLFYKGHYIDLLEEFEDELNKVYVGCEFLGSEYDYTPEGYDYPFPSIMHNLKFFVATWLTECTINDPISIE